MTPDASVPLPDPVDDLIKTLDLQPVGEARIHVDAGPGGEEADLGDSAADIFVGQSQPQPHGRVFGGQVLAQCIIAAGKTVAQGEGETPRFVHSLHGYFLRPGDSLQPIRFAVERLRDGGSFSARRVHALQHGQVILSMILSFQTPAEGLDHQAQMPAAPSPDRLPTVADELGHIDHPMAEHWSNRRAIDVRHVEGSIYLQAGEQAAAHQNVWMRAGKRLPDDPLLHAAVLAYGSDYTLLESILRKHRLPWADRRIRAASLDHAMWFHRPVRADEWVLYQQESPSASGGRGLGMGKMFSADGTLVATVAQEGMVRLKE
ncbi:acyl-CoA thioesterase [Luteipulveratus mongoliensis]|uniref:Acyl-CoA thioesterase 2 n=1 Tax=Luteipulveratus mongoliensis TaxID=571913 RepID=A0A0K1JLE5_9MICO|nr:acyl-CoA thioesterase II [Luteipulveratus mongoliensis]AKU17398.1 acyl-CoA thioesterase [Luteipulveratus mongoliensis]